MPHSFDAAYWEQVWHAEHGWGMSAAPPNPHLVREVGDLAPGTALDAGCGAGAEAIWLAGRGWQVTGVDIAADALARAAERASAGGAAQRPRWVETDLSVWEPQGRYDLVTTHYAHPSIPQLEFYDRIASWVAPSGTLLVVAHLQDHISPAHGHDHGQGQGQGQGIGQHEATRRSSPPGAASVTATDITARLDPAVWTVRTALETERVLRGPDGQEVSVADVVVRATRHG